jgi:hypothetical protein
MNGPNSSASDIADDGTVVGWTGPSDSNDAARAFIHTTTGTVVLPPVPNGTATRAEAVAGDFVAIIGRAPTSMTTSANHAFLYHESTFVPVGIPAGYTLSGTVDVNASGVALVLAGRSVSTAAYVYERGLLRSLTNLLQNSHGVFLVSPRAITPQGVIVATGSTQTATTATMILTPIYLAGDAQPDCQIDVDDIISVIVEWGHSNSPADVTGDGTVDVDDFISVILNWSR